MERATNDCQMLEQLMCPAFTVKDGSITLSNQAAQQRQILPGTPIRDLISDNLEDYTAYTQGKLCLCLSMNNTTYPATVTTFDGGHLFCLESDYEKPELRAYALAAQVLREPLSNAMTGVDQLLQHADEATAEQIAKVNRSLHQLLRAVGNMSDTAQYSDHTCCTMKQQDIMWVFDEILQKAAPLTEKAGTPLDYNIPNYSVVCSIDREKLERAVFNLVSNAAKYTQKGNAIRIRAVLTGNRISLTVENTLSGSSAVSGNLFARYLREPGIEDARCGLGLGLSIVRSVAAMHGGTVLMENPNDAMRITMSIPVRKTTDNVLRSSISLPVNYTGGYVSELIELSDCIPHHFYDGKI